MKRKILEGSEKGVFSLPRTTMSSVMPGGYEMTNQSLLSPGNGIRGSGQPGSLPLYG